MDREPKTLTIIATSDELEVIKESLNTRQRAEVLLRASEQTISRLAKRSVNMSLFYDRDDRSHNPNQDNRRWGQFKKGWNAFVEGSHIDPQILIERLTYNNLGYRMAANHNAAFTWQTNEDRVRQAYDLAVNIQADNLKIRGGKSPGNRPNPDFNVTI